MTPGVYLNLPEEDYFAADALGSSDLKKLLRAPTDWWYSSRHNQHYEPSDTSEARILGRALHALMLEGRGAYDERFSIEPDPLDYPDAAKNVADVEQLLDANGIDFKKSWSKGEKVEAGRSAGLGGEIWDCITAQHVFNVQKRHMEPIKARQHRALIAMGEIADGHEMIGTALKQGLSEVSVFFEIDGFDGILFRARLDSVSPGYTLDLKSLSNWKGRTISDMARRQIEEFEYDIQRRYYDMARQAMREHIKAGRIIEWDSEKEVYTPIDFLSPDRDKAAIDTLDAIAEADHWKWVWLFFQLRDDKAGKAPILIPRFHEPHGEVWEGAGKKIAQALINYQEMVARFGLDQPWTHIEPVEEIEDSDLGGLRFKEVV